MSSPTPIRRSRQDVEILRILSCFGIVWFHNGRDTWGVGYGGLVVFLVFSTFFAAAPGRKIGDWKHVLLERSRRLLIPWGFWMVVFGVRNHWFADRYVIETDRGWINGVLAGTNIHLWYLPFIFAVAVAVDLLLPRLPRRSVAWTAGFLSAFLLALAARWRPWADTHGFPTIQYLHAIPAVLTGLFLAGSSALGWGWTSTWLLAILGASAWNQWSRLDGVGTTYLVGAGATALVLLRPIPLPGWLRLDRISACAFGVYLCHPLWLGLFEDMESVPRIWEAWFAFGAALGSTLLARTLLPRPTAWIS